MHFVTLLSLFLGQAQAEEPQTPLPSVRPLVPPSTSWNLNDYCLTQTVGPRDFYLASQGPYLQMSAEGVAKLKQVGLHDRVIPGHINATYLKWFHQEERDKASPAIKRMFEDILAKGWPVHTLFYHRFQGHPPPSDELVEIIDKQWIGDGQPETVYRLEPVFHYLKTGERWVGSSMHLWNPERAKLFFASDLLPRLEKDLPFVRDLKHKWTRPELRRLSDLYCEEFYRPSRRAIAWGMYVGNYHLAGLPGTRCIAEKGDDAFTNARARGMMRQNGGGKFYFVWRGHEPTAKRGRRSSTRARTKTTPTVTAWNAGSTQCRRAMSALPSSATPPSAAPESSS